VSGDKATPLFSPTEEHLATLRSNGNQYPDRYRFAECLEFLAREAPEGIYIEDLLKVRRDRELLALGLLLGVVGANENVKASESKQETIIKNGALIADVYDWVFAND